MSEQTTNPEKQRPETDDYLVAALLPGERTRIEADIKAGVPHAEAYWGLLQIAAMTLENAQFYLEGPEDPSYETAMQNTLADLLSELHEYVGGDWQRLETYYMG